MRIVHHPANYQLVDPFWNVVCALHFHLRISICASCCAEEVYGGSLKTCSLRNNIRVFFFCTLSRRAVVQIGLGAPVTTEGCEEVNGFYQVAIDESAQGGGWRSNHPFAC